MKKALSIIIAAALIFSCVCGCEKQPSEGTSSSSASAVIPSKSVFRDARKFSEGEGTPWSFDNSYYKLTRDKSFTVGYIGGSVTVGTGSTEDECWRAYTTKWFRENYKNAEVTSIDSGYGGTSSLWGLARLQTMIIDKKPDLVFIEFSINDLYNYIYEDQSAALMDGMIHKINSQLPNCDIVILSVVDNQTVKAQSLNAKMHQAVAKYYGVSWLDMGVPMNEAFKETGKEWKDFASDSVHPNKAGYEIYGDYIKEYLAARLKESAARNPDKLIPHTLPDKPYTDNSAMKAETVWVKDVSVNSDMWQYMDSKTAKYGEKCIRGKEGATLEYEFSGSLIAIFGDFSRSKIDCTLDGANDRKIGYSDEIGEIILYDNLNPDEKHTLKLTVNGTKARITAFLIG